MDEVMARQRYEFHCVAAANFEWCFSQIWRRTLSAEERAIVRTSAVFLTFGRIELVAETLKFRPTVEAADETMTMLRELLIEHRAEIVACMEKTSGAGTVTDEFPDMLSWEATLREKAARQPEYQR